MKLCNPFTGVKTLSIKMDEGYIFAVDTCTIFCEKKTKQIVYIRRPYRCTGVGNALHNILFERPSLAWSINL